MKNQPLFSWKDTSKKSTCRLLQFLFGALKVGSCPNNDKSVQYFFFVLFCVAFINNFIF